MEFLAANRSYAMEEYIVTSEGREPFAIEKTQVTVQQPHYFSKILTVAINAGIMRFVETSFYFFMFSKVNT